MTPEHGWLGQPVANLKDWGLWFWCMAFGHRRGWKSTSECENWHFAVCRHCRPYCSRCGDVL